RGAVERRLQRGRGRERRPGDRAAPARAASHVGDPRSQDARPRRLGVSGRAKRGSEAAGDPGDRRVRPATRGGSGGGGPRAPHSEAGPGRPAAREHEGRAGADLTLYCGTRRVSHPWAGTSNWYNAWERALPTPTIIVFDEVPLL